MGRNALALACALCALALPLRAADYTGTYTVQVKKSPPVLVVGVHVTCHMAPGDFVASISSPDGSFPIVLSGDAASFALSSPTTPTNVIIGPNGIPAAECTSNPTHSLTYTITVP